MFMFVDIVVILFPKTVVLHDYISHIYTLITCFGQRWGYQFFPPFFFPDYLRQYLASTKKTPKWSLIASGTMTTIQEYPKFISQFTPVYNSPESRCVEFSNTGGKKNLQFWWTLGSFSCHANSVSLPLFQFFFDYLNSILSLNIKDIDTFASNCK